jgi:hypothetical protein
MPLSMNLWKVNGDALSEIPKTRLNSEERLETWIANHVSILGLNILIVGRQVITEHGGRIDLLGIDPQGDITILELKRDKTPREVVAQVLDYASWIKALTPKHIDSIASEYLGEKLAVAFSKYFDCPLPEALNTNHSMIIVASELDDSSERIVKYLADEHGININVIFFNFFSVGNEEILGRTWLINPEEVLERSEMRRQVPWSGYWFVNVGEGVHRNWDDDKEYGFIGAGGGKQFSSALNRLSVGDKIFAYMKGIGYVGFGEVTEPATMVKYFIVGEKSDCLLELPLKQPNIRENSDDPELSEWVVGIKWLKTYPREEAKRFSGIFANQNIVCKLRHEATTDFLRREFESDDS